MVSLKYRHVWTTCCSACCSARTDNRNGDRTHENNNEKHTVDAVYHLASLSGFFVRAHVLLSHCLVCVARQPTLQNHRHWSRDGGSDPWPTRFQEQMSKVFVSVALDTVANRAAWQKALFHRRLKHRTKVIVFEAVRPGQSDLRKEGSTTLWTSFGRMRDITSHSAL